MKDEGLIKDRYELMIGEIQTFLWIGYLMMIAMGMLFNFFKFREFGINIFDYGDVFDFLIAPFAELKILLFSLFSLFFAYIFFLTDAWWEKKFPKSYSKAALGWNKYSWYNRYRFGVFTFLFLTTIVGAAQIYGRSAARDIKNQAPVTIEFSDKSKSEGILIGKTNEVLFLLVEEEVKITPITSFVKEIKIKN